MSRIAIASLAALALCLPARPARSQDADSVTADEAIETAREYWSIKTPEPEACPENEDPDTIVVCQERTDAARFLFDRPPDRRVGADFRTNAGGVPLAPDFNDSCLHTRGRRNCNMGGWVPPPAYMVDFDSLPETPAGSDAARLYGGPTDADDAGADRPEGAPERELEAGEQGPP